MRNLTSSARWVLAALCLLLPLAALAWGGMSLDWREAFEPASPTFAVLWQLRAPRVLTCLVAGAGLGLAGLVFQTVFANALATPYTLGVSSGASLGAVLVLFFAARWVHLQGFVPLGAACGAFAATALVASTVRRGALRQMHAMLLAGVAVNFFFSSIILLVQAMATPGQIFGMTRWLMGGVSVVGFAGLPLPAAVLLLVGFLLYRQHRALDVLLLGDDLAQSKGVAVRSLRISCFLLVSLLVGGIVSTVGPIGFIGLIVPHAVRLFWGPSHRRALPLCALLGGLLLIGCDLLARVLLAPRELPVGVVTALLGSPLFFWLVALRNPS